MNQNKRSVQFLKIYSIILSILLIVFIIVGFRFSHTNRFVEIDVERINIVESDGRVAMIISNSQSMPGAIVDGREWTKPKERAGMLFYNHKGNESGGLTFSTKEINGEIYASAGLAFDQYEQDQIISIEYGEDAHERSAGIFIVDRNPEVTMGQILEKTLLAMTGTEEEQSRARAWLEQYHSYGKGWSNRVVIGSHNRNAMIMLNDTKARPRIVLTVDSTDVAKIQFLDAAGEVTHTLP